MESNSINWRIQKLRYLMQLNNIDTYLIVSDDFHMSEYVGDYFKCREFMSGFTGSAGTLVISKDEVCLWTDGRYFLQAESQLQGTEIILQRMGEEGIPTIDAYLKETMQKRQTIAYDGRTISIEKAENLKHNLKKRNLIFKEDVDLVNEIWNERPSISKKPIWELEEQYAGKSRKEKLAEIRKIMLEQKIDNLLIASLDDIAWLYNLRGDDIDFCPLFLSYTLISKNEVKLYVQQNVIDDELAKSLEEDGIQIKSYEEIYQDLSLLKKSQLFLDKRKTNVALLNVIPKCVKIVSGMLPTTQRKAIKNSTEKSNVKYAHFLDGIALTKLICWLKKMDANDKITELTELDICEKIKVLRENEKGYLGESFAPIVATGEHGAIVHYEPTKSTNKKIQKNSFLLMDTGGHYLYGTTDVTRTVSIGNVTEEQKKHYTAVLRGHLRVAMARFSYGEIGEKLDYVARDAIRKLGLDYNHGTGHGVGYLLNVHEGPQVIPRKRTRHSVILEDGMIISDEPGIYLEGKYGIRIENLLLCKKNDVENHITMQFENLTLVPYEREAIIPKMLTDEELVFLNHYHRNVYEKLSPYLDEEEKAWLKEQTREIIQ